jgi:hypothetical protein
VALAARPSHWARSAQRDVGSRYASSISVHHDPRKRSSSTVAAVGSLNATTTKFGGFDPLGALQLAGESLHHSAPGAKHVVVMIGNGWQQTDRINLFRWRDNPAKHADDVIRQLKNDRTLPNLGGADVVIAGLTRGDPKLKMGAAEFAGLRTFWEKIIAASRGHLLWDQAYLPGMTAPL